MSSRRARRPSAARRAFVATIQAQITGTRILAVVTFLVLAGSAAAWLTSTTGSPIVGYYFIALAAVLTVTVYAFLQLMAVFTRAQSGLDQKRAPVNPRRSGAVSGPGDPGAR